MPRDGRRRAAHAEREQQRVDPQRQGDAIVSSRELQRALGNGAWRVWTALLGLRNNKGETHVTSQALERAAQLNKVGVKRALRRLREARLLEDIGKLYALVPCRRCPDSDAAHHHEVYQRLVFGQLVAGEAALSVPRVRVPAATAKWVASAPGWGGRRKGAGRPEGIAETEPRAPKTRRIKMYPTVSRCTPYKNQRRNPEEPTALQGISSAPGEPAVETLSSPAERQPRKGKVPAQPLTAVQEAVLAAAGRLPKRKPLTPAKGAPMASPAGSASRSDVPGEPEWSASESTLELGFRGQGGQPQRFSPEDRDVLDLLYRSMPKLHIPDPPQISEEATPEEQLALLARGWRAGYEKVTGKRWWAPKGRSLSEAQRKKLLECAEALRQAEVSPTAWMVFSMRLWTGTMGKKGAPAQGWVWAAGRVKQHARWCREAVGSFARRPAVWTPASRALAERLSDLNYALGRGRPTHTVVEEILPAAMRADLLARAKAEAIEAEREISQRIEAGEWMWS